MASAATADHVMIKSELEGLMHVSSGKVREMYDLGDKLLIVTTDRISAFDVVLPVGIPKKGEVLNRLSEFWFRHLKTPNHLITCDITKMPGAVRRHKSVLRGRSMLAKKAKPFPVECVARGYLAGSGWKDYQATSAVCGHKLPLGMQQAQKLPKPIFTPATKAATGHDENIDFKTAMKILGKKTAEELRRRTLDLYSRAALHAERRGIILADTKFEFGEVDGKILLIDEALTPDSSRFWPKSDYKVGMSPPSFDKQFVRDYLESVAWNKQPPAPPLPDDVVRKTSEKYRDAYRLLAGKPIR
jgi:phosphoribosylaminoimidazole-succinocarboxamide synthase